MNIEYQHNVAQPPTLTHGELCRIACDFLQREGFKVAFNDRFRTKTQYGELPDAIGFRKWTSCLIEVKCSRADLLADRKKRFRITPDKSMGNWRFFLSEPGIVEISDLPEGWGLLHVIDGQVINIHGWKGNTMWLQREKKPFKANKEAENAFLCDVIYFTGAGIYMPALISGEVPEINVQSSTHTISICNYS